MMDPNLQKIYDDVTAKKLHQLMEQQKHLIPENDDLNVGNDRILAVRQAEEIVKELYENRINFLETLSPEQQILINFLEGITAFEGTKGTGKTTAAIAIAYQIRENFGVPIVTDFPLKKAFGPYQQINIEKFVKDLREISKQAKRDYDEAENLVDELMKSGRHPSITNSFMILDEAYRFMDSRTPSDKVVRLFGYWVSQIRHFRTSLIIIAPHLDMLDKRVVRQIDRVARSIHLKQRNTIITVVNDSRRDKPIRLRIDPTNYWPMFDSWVFTPFRMSHMNIGGE